MMKKRILIVSLVSITSFAAAGVVANFSNSFVPYINTLAEEHSTNITLNESNRPTITGQEGTLVYNQYASFTYENAFEYLNGHVRLGENGTIVKNEASNQLLTFKATFDGVLTLKTGYQDSNDVSYVYELQSNTLQEVRGNYFRLETTTGADISEIQIVFGCETSEVEQHNFSNEWTTDEDAHWHKCNDEHCVKMNNYSVHNVVDIDIVAPTKETTGSYNGKKCSVCERVVTEPTVLPVLSEEDYYIEYRTAMVGGQVRDSEKYTLKTDPTIYFDIGYGDTVYSEYIHAGTSYYSLNRWNQLFPNAQATAVDGVLTITLSGDTILTSEEGGDLDGQLDLMLYDSVIIAGSGTLTITYSSQIDGIEAWNLEIQENATLNLTGFDETSKTGLKIYGTLAINGTVNISKCGYAVGFNTDKDGSSDLAYYLNIGSTGKLNIEQVRDGVHVWNSPTNKMRFNISGILNINANEDAIQLEAQTFVYFKEDAKVTLNAVGAGIYGHDENGKLSPDNRITLSGNAQVDITTTEGCGIKFGNTGRLFVQDSSKLNINSGSSGINGYVVLIVGNGTQDSYSKNSASLIVKIKGVSSGTHAMTSNVNPIGATGSSWCATIFNTVGEVLIEKLGERSSTGIHLGGKASNDLHFRVLCSNMTIKNCSNAIGCWVSVSGSKLKFTYTNDGEYAPLNIVNCENICNTDCPSGIKSKITSSTVNVVTE